MKIAVCLKLVPATTADLRVAPDGLSLQNAGVEIVPSPYDEYALEIALKIRESLPGSVIHALTVGGEESVKVLQHAFTLGVDQGLLLKGQADSAFAALAVAEALKSIAPDLVLCGRQAIDDDQWLFAGALGEALGWPHVSAAFSLVLGTDGKSAECRRRFGRDEQVLAVALPAVISCDKGATEPRPPTLKGRLEGRKKQPEVRTLENLGLSVLAQAPLIYTKRLSPPPQKAPGRMVSGAPAEAAKELVRLLRDEAKVI